MRGPTDAEIKALGVVSLLLLELAKDRQAYDVTLTVRGDGRLNLSATGRGFDVVLARGDVLDEHAERDMLVQAMTGKAAP